MGAAVPSDLWNALQTAVDAATNKPVLDGQTVASIMNTWASQAGYPVVTVTRTTAGAISIAQVSFSIFLNLCKVGDMKGFHGLDKWIL